MLALVWPHRRAMGWGLFLGLGVALTYAVSLGGMLPVLKVIVDRHDLSAYLRQVAEAHSAWYSGMLAAAADWLPRGGDAQAAFRTLLYLLGALLVLNVIGNVLRCLSQYLVLYASHRAMMDLRRAMYRKALHVPPARLTGEVSERVTQFMSDAREVFLGITTMFGKVAREPLKAVCILTVALVLDWRITLVVVAITPPAVAMLWFIGRLVRKATLRMLQGYGAMLRGLEETLQGIDVVKGYAREGLERRRLWQVERRLLKPLLRLSWIEAGSSPLLELAGVGVAVAGIVWLASQTLSGQMETSRFLTMIVLLTAMLDPIRKVAGVYNAVQRATTAAGRIFEFLDEPEECSRRRATALPPDGGRGVRFERVTFRYDASQEPPALAQVSLDVRPGECVALVGPNGSGKSTLVKLLSRLIDPQLGQVLIDGVDLRELSLRALRREVAVVSQRPVIFARTARENIAYGHERAAFEQVREAAQRAYAAEFIEAWPDGYETELGEFGSTLSGGQRQRLAIARAFLKPARILVFDEATSEIDADSERKIHDALSELRAGKTTFLIAHRHTVMDLADRIAVFDQGRIVDVGTHDELIERCPLYAGLYRAPADTRRSSAPGHQGAGMLP
jgi:subfamily B ATP-binding cassette protein MsbA